MFPECEDKLYEKFVHRRKVQGLSVDSYWLRHKFSELITDAHPEKARDFMFSEGWVYNFCKRKFITNQMKTEKKYLSVEMRCALEY